MIYILPHIIEVLEQAKSPLRAKEIVAQLISNNISRPIDVNNHITSEQIRRAIRDDKNNKIETIKSSPLTYSLKKNDSQLWVLKTVPKEDKASQTDDYQDSLKEYYNYDNLVANSQQIKGGDLAIIIDRKNILGFVSISSIDSSIGSKTIRRCPECPSTTIDKRKTKRPIYRCNKGHEFDEPIKELKSVTKYKANFDHFVYSMLSNNDLLQLRPFYSSGYNQNMSIQKLDYKALDLFPNLKISSNNDKKYYNSIRLMPYQSYTEEDEEEYKVSDEDEREIVKRGIKLRRGQQKFRDSLLKRYNNTCVITGCKIVDILEAAHIRPYRGKNDNQTSNGLLLRADIHTLFDLNLIAIDPSKMSVHFHPKVKDEYSQFDGFILFNDTLNKPNKEALALHFNIFKSIILKNL
ncbi:MULTISPECIES: HNH endonuclease [unclassified Sphingobacterium]|uniref:HNH endonuclease n=1 Tax=unclassified Sphingobacterium TaxID=2609468 RepID=UPI0025FDF66B|nr:MULTISPECIES: HNH endonuclease signature motif containing protein [unclassified Sphingobacterium]